MLKNPLGRLNPSYTGNRQIGEPPGCLINSGLKIATEIASQPGTAYHEAGHAIVSLVLRPNVRIEKVTIIAEHDFAGYVKYDESNPYYHSSTTREDFLENLCVLMAGRIAQVIQFGELAADSGAQSDFGRATAQAWQGITELSLDEEFGPIVLPALAKGLEVKQGWLFDEAQRRLQIVLKQQYSEAQKILKTHWTSVDAVAQLLLVKKTINEEEIRKLMSQ